MKKKTPMVECFKCGMKVPKDKLNQTDLCPECAKAEEEMIKTSHPDYKADKD